MHHQYVCVLVHSLKKLNTPSTVYVRKESSGLHVGNESLQSQHYISVQIDASGASLREKL